MLGNINMEDMYTKFDAFHLINFVFFQWKHKLDLWPSEIWGIFPIPPSPWGNMELDFIIPVLFLSFPQGVDECR